MTSTIASAQSWFDVEWVKLHWGDALRSARDHLLWAALAFAVGFVLAVLLVMLGRRWRSVDPPLRAFALVASAVPAVGIVSGMMPTVTSRPLILGSVALSVTALVYRATMHGLDRVDQKVVAEAITLGHSRWSRLTRVEFPMSLLAIRSGVRSAAVAAIGLIAVGGQMLRGGLGLMVRDAWTNGPRTQRVVGLLLIGVLCLVVDVFVRIALRPVRRSA
jgi:ABC-type proline/glycine betaine transport system permease subunit